MGNVLLEAKELAFSYPGSSESVFSGASFFIYAGDKTALLGDNGSGKTTLLRLIAGELEPERGSVSWRNGDVFLLRQEDVAGGDMSAMAWVLSSLDRGYRRGTASDETAGEANAAADLTEAGGWELRDTIIRAAAGLGFDDEALERPVESFSGGERKMLALMAGFLRGPDMYLLDEPTNYLDGSALKRLVDAIKVFKGACLVVSHDRAFLDRCVDKVFELERLAFSIYAGNYASYAEQKSAAFARAESKKEKIEREISGLKEMERNYRNWGAAKEKEKKGAADKGFIGARAARLQKKSARAAERAREKIEELERSKPFVQKNRRIFFSGGGAKSFLKASSLGKKAGDNTLFSDLSFYLKSGDRLCVEGDNGTGKSTLLRILADEISADFGTVVRNGAAKVFYLPQFWRAAGGVSKGSDYFPPESLQAACTMLDQLGAKGEMMFEPLAKLSEGQRRKVELSRFLVCGADIAILDEPTTHLDIRSIKILEEALGSFQGILVVVSHDIAFRRKINGVSLTLAR
ncbi:MAG: ABC-F family ATP-binding cassette domain-containing protein [Elusimicrobiales bacterium]|jgi:ATPase subunit of ABC transporter with duplicated ATPase domains